MRFSSTIVFAAAAVDAAAVARCNADNCLRALRATQIPGRLESAQAFCATFTSATVAPTSIPTYAADNCKGDVSSRLSSACSCIAPATTTTTVPTATAACAEMSSSWAAQIGATAVPTVEASLAYECLNSVPLHKDEAIKLVDAIEPYLEWQSDAGFKKDPPADYFYKGFDIFGNLANVKANLQAGTYKNEFAFQTDLYKTVIGMGHDGHYLFYPDLLGRVLRWRRQNALVSISKDGKALPEIKFYSDVVSSPDTASAIKLINGIKASKYVEDTINAATYNQDVDAAYNSMFYEQSFHASAGLNGYFISGGRISVLYQGPNTTYTFENGTVLATENKASISGNLEGVTDGASLYKKFCTPQTPPPAAPAPSPEVVTQLEGFPVPEIITEDGVVSGYFLDGEGLDDVAVIVLTAFENESPAEFQAVCRDFFNEAVAAGKTKLVIDFQGNGGGYILQGYDFFRQLFPDVVQDGFSRWKANDGFLATSHAFSDEVAGVDVYTTDDEDLIADQQTWFNYRYDLNLTDDPFLTFEDKFDGQAYKDTPYTSLMRWNLTDPLTTINETYGLGTEISGYGSLEGLPQPFAPENIVMLYDGVCASTCTLASEMLRIQGGVKSVAFGGRPIEGPIQGVGGVKGSQILNYVNIFEYTQRAASLTKDPKRLAALKRYTNLPMQRSTASAVNVRDQILRDNVNDGVPAQFIAEEADCRLYWTAPMITDVSEIWKAAANSAFNGAKCAWGGITPSKSVQARASHVAGGKAGQRLSKLIDTTPQDRSAEWLAVHQLKVVD